MLSVTALMHLSEQEKNLVERLRKQQQSTIRWRWVGLAAGLTCIGAGAYALVLLQQCFRELDLMKVLLIAIIFPFVFGLLALGGGLVMHILSRWNGSPQTQLLLRLIDGSHDT